MWRWIKRWADWLRNDLLPLTRTRRNGHAVHIRYEVAAQACHDLPIPWTADALTIEVQLCLPRAVRRKVDFTLRFPGTDPIAAEAVRPDTGERHRVVFRLPIPRSTVSGELLWKHRLVALITVPILTPAAFLSSLVVAMPTLAGRFGHRSPPSGASTVGTCASLLSSTAGSLKSGGSRPSQAVDVQSYVAEGCRGLIAAAVLRTPYQLGPAMDLGLSVVFRSDRSGQTFSIPVLLGAEQRAASEAIVTATCPRVPRRPGGWFVAWRIGEQDFATRRVEVITDRQFEESVRILDARFAITGKGGAVQIIRQPPTSGSAKRIAPCFLVASSKTGAVSLCRLSVFTVTSGEPDPLPLADQEVLVTDAPTPFTPGLIDVTELTRVSGFELRLNGRAIGTISLSPVPPATLTAEGGFKPAPEFTWTPAAEDELLDRLRKLGTG